MRATATLDWYGCATFRLVLPGEREDGRDLVVFLDAYVDRVPGAAGPGLRAEDIDRADWAVIGHSHFDHLWGAERIARQTGATVVGSHESVRILDGEGVPTAQLLPVAGGERIRIGRETHVSVFPSLHSCVWSHQGMAQAHEVCLGDLRVDWHGRQARMGDLFSWVASLGDETRAHLRASDQGARGDGGAFVYLFETPQGSLLYQDTSGHWSGILQDLRPDVAILAAAGRGNVDGEPVQGSLAQFVARQASLLKPGRVVLGHHDDWLPGFSVATDTKPIREELGRWLPRCELVETGYLAALEVFG
ncbi:MAG: MBL fold metallo-hydrolase [Acidimicrobiia bacterium]|nr:MBL fold metallo-hydrolase [Acidimicrobiia bacterium]